MTNKKFGGELRVGGLALVIGFTRYPANVGKTVELVAFLKPGARIDYGGTTIINAVEIAGWLVSGDGLMRYVMKAGLKDGNHAIISPEHLMPIDQLPEEEKQRESDLERYL